MPNNYVSKILTTNTRVAIRDEVIGWFLNEVPGTGNGSNTSYYEYVVDSYSNYEIFIKRPAMLNKGFDFTVNVRSTNASNQISFLTKSGKRKVSNPSHDNIIDILDSLKKSNAVFYTQNIIPVINQIYNCQSPRWGQQSIASFGLPHLANQQFPIEIILLCLKWLFIEQDITYWNWSGRGKLYSTLQSKGLV